MTTRYDEQVIFNDDVTFQGPVHFNDDVELPDGVITNEEVATSAEIDASKLKHRHSKSFSQATGVDVVTATYLLHLARAAGVLKGLRIRPITAPAGGDKLFTVDVKKVPSGIAIAAGTTLLTTPLSVAAGAVNNTNLDGVVAAAVYAAGDMIIAIVTASGSTGAQGQGLIADMKLDESGV